MSCKESSYESHVHHRGLECPAGTLHLKEKHRLSPHVQAAAAPLAQQRQTERAPLVCLPGGNNYEELANAWGGVLGYEIRMKLGYVECGFDNNQSQRLISVTICHIYTKPHVSPSKSF